MRNSGAVLATSLIMLGLFVAAPGSAQEPGEPATPPAVAPSASETAPPPPPPPPPPQAGTRVVATRVGPTSRGAADVTREIRVVVVETDVAGVSGGWSVTAAVAGDGDGNGRGAVRPDAVTVTGDGGVPRATVGEGAFGGPTTLLEVAGQQAERTYEARYLTLGTVRFPQEGAPPRPVVTVTLIQ